MRVFSILSLRVCNTQLPLGLVDKNTDGIRHVDAVACAALFLRELLLGRCNSLQARCTIHQVGAAKAFVGKAHW